MSRSNSKSNRCVPVSPGGQQEPKKHVKKPKVDATKKISDIAKNGTTSSGEDERILFTFEEIDDGGKWSILELKHEDAKRLFKRMQYITSLTMRQASDTGILCPINYARRPKSKAARRLAEKYEGLDSLHELRIERSQDARLHGRVQGRVFSVIWWDPHHEVCPEGKNSK
jgi:hypothetical protein